MFNVLSIEVEATHSMLSKLKRAFSGRKRSRDDHTDHLLAEFNHDKNEPDKLERKRYGSFTVLLALVTIIRLGLSLLLPSFLHNLFGPRKPRVLHRTSFLDGLRGCAAFIVAYVHLICADERWLLPAYGLNEDDKLASSPLQLPFIRVLFAARPMVHIFFIISGYVLSCKAIHLIRKGDHEKLQDVMTSMIFRRGFRLFLPSLVGLAIMDVSAWYGLQLWQPPALMYDKIMNIAHNAGILMFSWEWDWENSQRLLQLWTIPVEFACSMLLFLVLNGCSRMKAWVRGVAVSALMVHSHASGHWGPFEFLVGMALAEIEDFLSERRTAVVQRAVVHGFNVRGRSGRLITRSAYNTLWGLIFLAGLFLAGYPEDDAELAFGFRNIRSFTPKVYLDRGGPLPSYFWFSIAATLIVTAIFRLSLLRRVFETPFAMYLGDISYSIYIVHYWSAMSFGHRFVSKAHYIVGGNDTQIKRILVVVLEILMFMPLAVWQADIFWRVVDKPSISFARWLEQTCRRASAV